MRIGCKTGGPGDGVSYRGSHGQTVRVGRSAIYAILKQKPYNFTTNTLKAYLSAQASSLSAFVISKTHKWPKATRKTAKRKSVRS